MNTFFAQLEERTGLCAPTTLAKKMGVTVPDRDVVGPFTLGVTDVDPLTMAGVYATFAARGKFCEPRPVTTVLNSNGKTIEDYPATCKQLLRNDVADAVNDILKGVQEGDGFGASAGLVAQPGLGRQDRHDDDNKAVWFDGYTPNLATVAMIAGANSMGHPLPLNGQTVGGVFIEGAHGSTTAGPMWGDAMNVIQDYLPDESFTTPNPQTIEGQSVIVPSLGGQGTDAAGAALRQAGFVPVVGPTVDSSYPAGTVAYLSPGSGTSVGTGSTVTIYVSDGTPYVAPQPPPQTQQTGRTATGTATARERQGPQERQGEGARRTLTRCARRQPFETARASPPQEPPSWRRTSAETAPPSARPFTWGWSAPITLPMARMPSPATPSEAMVAVTSSEISASLS